VDYARPSRLNSHLTFMRGVSNLNMDDLLFSYADSSTPPLKRQVIRLIERATGQPKLKRMYFENQRNPQRNALAKVPDQGPVVANHPYGVLDGLAIGWLAEKVRRDFLILTHAVLMRAGNSGIRIADRLCRNR
jgi:hypothetical protein